MPQIPIYNAPEQDTNLRIPEGGASTLAQSARRLGTLGQETAHAWQSGIDKLGQGIGQGLKSIDDTQTQAQMSKAPLLIAKDQANRLDDINRLAMTTEPGDLTAKMSQYVDESMSGSKDAYMANFTTTRAKAHAEELWGKHEAELYNHASAISAQAGLDQNHNDLVQSVNTFADTAGKHPSVLDTNLDFIDQTIDAKLSNLPEKQRDAFSTTFRQEAKSQAVASALKTLSFGSADGSIAPNPQAAKTLLDSGKYDDVIGKNKQMFNQIVTLGDHQVKQDATANAANADRAAQQRSDAATGQYLGNPTVPNLGLRVLHDDNVLPEDKVALISVSNKLASGPPPTTNPATIDHMLTRLTSQDRPSTSQLLNQVAAGNLSVGDAQFLMGQDPNSPALHQLHTTLTEGKSSLTTNRGSGVFNPASMEAYQRFQQFALNAYKSGEPIEVTPELMARFQPTHQDAAAAIPESARPSHLVAGGALKRPPTDAQLPFIAATESSDRNITNPNATSSGNAEGHYQITTGTWKDFAPGAGVSLAQYPSAIKAPKEVQAQVAKTIPLSRWDPRTIQYLAQKGVLSHG